MMEAYCEGLRDCKPEDEEEFIEDPHADDEDVLQDNEKFGRSCKKKHAVKVRICDSDSSDDEEPPPIIPEEGMGEDNGDTMDVDIPPLFISHKECESDEEWDKDQQKCVKKQTVNNPPTDEPLLEEDPVTATPPQEDPEETPGDFADLDDDDDVIGNPESEYPVDKEDPEEDPDPPGQKQEGVDLNEDPIVSCDVDQIWDDVANECVDDPDKYITDPGDPDDPLGNFFEPKCGDNQRWNDKDGGICECIPGYEWNESVGECSKKRKDDTEEPDNPKRPRLCPPGTYQNLVGDCIQEPMEVMDEDLPVIEPVLPTPMDQDLQLEPEEKPPQTPQEQQPPPQEQSKDKPSVMDCPKDNWDDWQVEEYLQMNELFDKMPTWEPDPVRDKTFIGSKASPKAKALFTNVNRYRLHNNLEPLIWSTKLKKWANSVTGLQTDLNRLEHTKYTAGMYGFKTQPGGENEMTEAENIGATGIAEDLFCRSNEDIALWKWVKEADKIKAGDTTNHNLNMLKPNLTHGSVGFDDNTDGEFWSFVAAKGKPPKETKPKPDPIEPVNPYEVINLPVQPVEEGRCGPDYIEWYKESNNVDMLVKCDALHSEPVREFLKNNPEVPSQTEKTPSGDPTFYDKQIHERYFGILADASKSMWGGNWISLLSQIGNLINAMPSEAQVMIQLFAGNRTLPVTGDTYKSRNDWPQILAALVAQSPTRPEEGAVVDTEPNFLDMHAMDPPLEALYLLTDGKWKGMDASYLSYLDRLQSNYKTNFPIHTFAMGAEGRENKPLLEKIAKKTGGSHKDV